jgi:hypothetical protein
MGFHFTQAGLQLMILSLGSEILLVLLHSIHKKQVTRFIPYPRRTDYTKAREEMGPMEAMSKTVYAV